MAKPLNRTPTTAQIAEPADTMRFSETVDYAVGDVVFYDGSFYRCTTAHSAGSWNASHFTVVIGSLSTGRPTAPDIDENSPDEQVANKKYVDERGGQADIGLSVVDGVINLTFEEQP